MIDNLRRRGRVLVNRCFPCKGEKESINHMVLHCRRTRRLSDAVYKSMGIRLVQISTMKEELSTWDGIRVFQKKRWLLLD